MRIHTAHFKAWLFAYYTLSFGCPSRFASSQDGCIYGVPSHATSVLRVDPQSGSVTPAPRPLFCSLLASVPRHSLLLPGLLSVTISSLTHVSRAVIRDCSLPSQVMTLGELPVEPVMPSWRQNGGKFKYGGSVGHAGSNCVYMFPSDAARCS